MLAALSSRRIITYASHKPTLGRINLRSFSSTTTTASESDADNDDGFVTGRVKFFDRNKLFGFANPFNEPSMDVFFHRTDFVTDLPYDDFPRNPFLQKNEKIRFKLEYVKEDGGTEQPKAKEITFLNGKPIPPLRRSFRARNYADVHQELGKHIHTIMEKNIAADSEEKLQMVQDAWKIAALRIQRIHDAIEKMGMRVEDFPETETPRKRPSSPTPENHTPVHD
mmetsp:Transcript_2180/g.4770  ORF Transcript_2180/g.4770 Transcript_2180/m.4770 type:complete len:224 (-) Transcript_2180:80-751(-)|eukprot:scaffold7349_cov173-Amphora_coffeaeformis.AAC.132